MALTQMTGPLILSGGGFTTGDQDQAPSLSWGGIGLVDPRQKYAPGAGTNAIYGFAPGNEALLIDQVPTALQTANIATLQFAASGTALSLVTMATTGVTIATAAQTIPQTGKVVPTGVLILDGAPAVVKFGQTGKVVIADPTKNIARAVSITANTSATGGAFLVSGYDLYGIAQTELITAAVSTTAVVTTNGKKGFKFVASVTPQFTDSSHSYSIGNSDIYEFPLRVDRFPYSVVGWNNAIIAASTGFTAAVTTTASNTTGSVRGTYATQSASDGTKALQMFIAVSPTNITSQAGMFGVPPA